MHGTRDYSTTKSTDRISIVKYSLQYFKTCVNTTQIKNVTLLQQFKYFQKNHSFFPVLVKLLKDNSVFKETYVKTATDDKCRYFYTTM